MLHKLQYMLFSCVTDIDSHTEHPHAWKRNANWKIDSEQYVYSLGEKTWGKTIWFHGLFENSTKPGKM